tara:strand:- start:176 stop:706 length:531 start_codon:yes stop_codon:yes gene_type:complete
MSFNYVINQTSDDPRTASVKKFVALHKALFPKVYNKITWKNVAEMEFEIEKKGNTCYLISSSFWVSHDRSEEGSFKIYFDESASAAAMAKDLAKHKVTIPGMAKEYGSLIDPRMLELLPTTDATFYMGTAKDNPEAIADKLTKNGYRYREVSGVPVDMSDIMNTPVKQVINATYFY